MSGESKKKLTKLVVAILCFALFVFATTYTLIHDKSKPQKSTQNQYETFRAKDASTLVEQSKILSPVNTSASSPIKLTKAQGSTRNKSMRSPSSVAQQPPPSKSNQPIAEVESPKPISIPSSAAFELTQSKPDFWSWVGIGANFQFYEQDVPTQSGSLKFQNIQTPTTYFSAGAQGENFGGELTYKETPGKMTAPANVTLINGNFKWQTVSSELIYRPSQSNWRFRLGLQHHSMPFIAFDQDELTLDVKTNTLTQLTVGIDQLFPISETLRVEWQQRYQHPISAGSGSGEEFSVTPKFAFDGSIGAVRTFKNNFRVGFFWYGQYHNYNFKYSGVDDYNGSQTLFYSNAEVRFGLEF